MPQPPLASKLPNFLIVGAARSGTTSLYHLLSEHPDVYMPTRKEPHYFTEFWDRGMAYYAPLWEAVGEEKARGEASVSYSYRDRPVVAQRITDTLGPGVKIIYLVRQPSERLFSHYLYYRYVGLYEPRPFDEAVEVNPVYREGSRYGSWFELYVQHFGADNVLLIPFEEMQTDSRAVASRVYQFLDVEPEFVPSRQIATNARFAPRNETIYRAYRRLARSRARRVIERALPQSLRPRLRGWIHGALGTRRSLPKLTPEAREQLDRELRPEVEKLSRLSGIDFVERWLAPVGSGDSAGERAG